MKTNNINIGDTLPVTIEDGQAQTLVVRHIYQDGRLLCEAMYPAGNIVHCSSVLVFPDYWQAEKERLAIQNTKS
jgi:hypothetical protein